jgi:hypothetical protein
MASSTSWGIGPGAEEVVHAPQLFQLAGGPAQRLPEALHGPRPLKGEGGQAGEGLDGFDFLLGEGALLPA